MPVGSNPEEGIIGRIARRQLSNRVSIQLEEVGNWRALSTQLDRLPVEVRRQAYKAMKNYGALYVAALKRNIKSSGKDLRPRWADYSEKYGKYKEKHGKGNAPMWTWTRTVRDAIHMTTQEKTFSVQVLVGQVYGSRGNRTGDPLNAAQIALILETGSEARGIAPRPLFYPTWRQMGGNRALSEYVHKHLSSTVRDHFIMIK